METSDLLMEEFDHGEDSYFLAPFVEGAAGDHVEEGCLPLSRTLQLLSWIL